ncbi:MAG: hypothetical protein AAFX50_02605, partial [Acidobacteriota bacterium]
MGRIPSAALWAAGLGLALAATVAAEGPTPAPGDACGRPLPAKVGANAFDTSTFTPSGAVDDPRGCRVAGPGAPDVWFRHTFAVDGLATVSTCSSSPAAAALSVYDGRGGCGALRQVLGGGDAVADEACPGGSTEGFFVASAGREYLIRVAAAGAGDAAGTFELALAPQPNPCDCVAGDAGCRPGLVAANPFPIPGPLGSAADGIFTAWW